MVLVNTAQMMVGPGKLRWATVGIDDTLIVAAYTPSWTNWNDVGSTDGGVKMSIAKSYANHTVDQVADWVASSITERHVTAQTDVAINKLIVGKLLAAKENSGGGLEADLANTWIDRTVAELRECFPEAYRSGNVQHLPQREEHAS